MPKVFQRVMDPTIGNIPSTNAYLDYILNSLKRRFHEHKLIVEKNFQPRQINFPVMWPKNDLKKLEGSVSKYRTQEYSH